MKKQILLLILLMVALLSSAEVLDRIIAKVGNDILLQSDLEKQMMQMRSAGMLDDSITEQDILEQMVEFKLVVQKAKDLDYVINDSQINAMAERRIEEIRKSFETETEFLNELKKSNMNRFDLLNYFKDMYKEQSLREQVIRYEIESKIEVSDIEIEEFYNQNKAELPLRKPSYKLGMILLQIKASDKTKQQRYKELEQIYERISRGESFSELAKKNSDCGSASAGGDLGYFGRGEMVKTFENTAYSLKPGEVSDIIETQFGYHIIKLEDIKENQVRARHILKALTPTKLDSLAHFKLMEQVIQRYNEGEAFGQLARKYSSDQETALKDGVIGIFPHGQYPPLYEDYFKDLQPGQISEIIQIQDMYYLFANLEDVPEGVYELEEIKDNVKEMAFMEKKQVFYQEWIDKIKQEIYVEITY
ncbi:peptidylprolyl isomerase [bacterium]|nr:peptidylprolyl isomerase [bacterium]